jgi:hypothetical protein
MQNMMEGWGQVQIVLEKVENEPKTILILPEPVPL